MIDLHSHILPGIDDGAGTIQDSIEMGRAAQMNGIHTVVATPHHKNGAWDNSGEDIPHLVDYVNESLKSARIDVKVLPGQENRINGELVDDLKKGISIGLNHSRYVFVEFSSAQVPRYAKQLMFELQVEGYVPVIVHPERTKAFREQPDLLHEFVKNGALTQVTAHCFTGKMNKSIKQFAEDMVTHNLTHVVSTDAHNIDMRPFDLREAYDYIDHHLGPEYVDTFLDNAERIIENRDPLLDEPLKIRHKKKFLGLF